MFVPRGTEYHVSPIYLQVRTYYVSFPPEFRPEFLSPEFRTKLILPWNDLIPTCVPTESGNAAEFRGFRKMRPGRNRNTKRNAHPRTGEHLHSLSSDHHCAHPHGRRGRGGAQRRPSLRHSISGIVVALVTPITLFLGRAATATKRKKDTKKE